MLNADILFGYKEYKLTGEDFERFFGKVTGAGLHIHTIRPIRGGITFRAWIMAENELKDIAQELELEIEKTSVGGLPFFLYRYKNRYGLLAGMLITAVFLLVMSLFVFDISVEGNYLIYEEDVLRVLEENGLYKGAIASNIDCESLKLVLMEEFDTIAYAFVNVKGSYAKVSITETVLPPSLPEETPCNIVASENGQIVRFETYKGEATALRGQGVKAGDLLVSGVIDSKRIGYRTVHASALVMARTLQEIEIFQPYITSVSELSGEEETVYVLDILGLKIYLGSKEPSFEAFYEETEKTDLALPNGKILPISLTKKTRYELTQREVILSEEDALKSLQGQLEERERIAFQGLEIEDKEEKITMTEDGIRLTVTYTVIKNIAEEREIYIARPG